MSQVSILKSHIFWTVCKSCREKLYILKNNNNLQKTLQKPSNKSVDRYPVHSMISIDPESVWTYRKLFTGACYNQGSYACKTEAAIVMWLHGLQALHTVTIL